MPTTYFVISDGSSGTKVEPETEEICEISPHPYPCRSTAFAWAKLLIALSSATDTACCQAPSLLRVLLMIVLGTWATPDSTFQSDRNFLPTVLALAVAAACAVGKSPAATNVSSLSTSQENCSPLPSVIFLMVLSVESETDVIEFSM